MDFVMRGVRRPRAGALTSLSLLVAIGAAACGGGTTPTDGGSDARADVPVDVPPPPPVVRLLVDANRNGAVEATGPDAMNHGTWSTMVGATFLANVDDDDNDHAVDALDEAVNGGADELDLARMQVAPWPTAPMDTVGRITMEGDGGQVRLFLHDANGWTVFDPATATLTGAQLRAGVELGVEGKDFASPTWNGQVSFTLAVTSATGTAIGTDQAVMHVAPLVVGHPLMETSRIWSVSAPDLSPSVVFIRDLDRITTADGMQLDLIDGEDPNFQDPMGGPDPWAQDFMEMGLSWIPGAGGNAQGMSMVIRTPLASRTVARSTADVVLAPDFGYVWKHTVPQIRERTYYPSLDSFGDMEVIPGYDHGDQHFPLGRIIHGSTPQRHADPALTNFLEAQQVQSPILRPNTNFLLVGHIDELISFVRTNTGTRGWNMLIASPRLARSMLQDLVTANAANANAMMFAGQRFYYSSGPMMGQRYPAQRTIGAILADTALASFNDMVQARIDAVRDLIQTEVGLADNEVVELPVIWGPEDGNLALALSPGTVNLLHYGPTVVIPRPHAAVIGGRDIFEADLNTRLGAQGLHVTYAEEWDLLHALEGEVHCGTNATRAIPTNTPWWEIPR